MPDIITTAREYIHPLDIDCVIYHANCSDGSGSAFVAWLSLQETASYISMEHGKLPTIEQIKDKNILVADFSFINENFTYVKQHAKNLIILDHHITAFHELKNTAGCFFDMQRSGAKLTWDYFNLNNKSCPEFIKYIEDRDLWKWEFISSKAFTASLSQFEQTNGRDNFDFRNYTKLLDPKIVQEFITKGIFILKDLTAYLAQQADLAQANLFIDKNNKSWKIKHLYLEKPELRSEIAETIYGDPNIDFIMLWYKEDDKYKVSLRSATDTDVASIARQFGGGGHKNAAGFVLDKSPIAYLSEHSQN